MAFNITDFSNKWANFKEEIKSYLNRSIDKNGDTMVGKLLLTHNPSENMEATTKEYVDSFWNFVPGDTVIQRSNTTLISMRNNMIDGDITFPYDIPIMQLRDNSHYQEVDVSKFAIYTNPKADGFVHFSGEVEPIRIVYLRYYGTGNQVDLSPSHDFEMSYAVKYCRDGYEDMVLYESPVFSAYEMHNNTDHPLRRQLFENTLPVSKGVAGYIKLENRIHSSTMSNLDSWWTIYFGSPSFGYTISIGNPMFAL
jgi:hypothetical protein